MSKQKDFVITSLKDFFSYAKSNSLWTYSLNLSCCGVEFLAAAGPRYDWDRFGSLIQVEPRNADLLIIAGPVTEALLEKIKLIYHEMLSPKYVISMGSCANTGGIFAHSSCSVIAGVDKVIPVDVYVPGCPPRPEALINGLLALQRKILSSKEVQHEYVE